MRAWLIAAWSLLPALAGDERLLQKKRGWTRRAGEGRLVLKKAAKLGSAEGKG
jgi:hypothetical protein